MRARLIAIIQVEVGFDLVGHGMYCEDGIDILEVRQPQPKEETRGGCQCCSCVLQQCGMLLLLLIMMISAYRLSGSG